MLRFNIRGVVNKSLLLLFYFTCITHSKKYLNHLNVLMYNYTHVQPTQLDMGIIMTNDMFTEKEVYHVYNKSIAGFNIFNNDFDYLRFITTLQYYQIKNQPTTFSKFRERKMHHLLVGDKKKNRIVQLICYCIMPTHIHLVLAQLMDNGISKFMNNILNSYSHYFNIKYKRKGPLWESRSKKVLVKTDEQLLHLTRYIHLNPVTAYIVDKPDEWRYSSYNEYISNVSENRTCNYKELIDIKPDLYKRFVKDRISYQRELKFLSDLDLTFD